VLLLLVPFAVFALVVLIGFVCMVTLAKRVKIKETDEGQEIHLETPLGSLDVEPRSKPDPRLAGMILYPGAIPSGRGAAGYESDIRFGPKHFRQIGADYWTSDPVDVVWEFYRRELPGWSVNLAHDTGHELVERTAEGERLIRVYRKKDRTVIEHSVRPSD
jgi:hypothetical protein